MGRRACAAREAALAAGEVRYSTGRPCAKGQVAERQTANGTCLECKNELEIERRRQVRSVTPYKRNPEARAAAKQAGEPYYRSGIPCVSGHVADRFTVNGLCVVCYKEWFEANRERLLLKMADYRTNNPDEVSLQKRRSRQKKPEKYLAYTKQWIKDNPERHRLNQRVAAHRRRLRVETSAERPHG
jgi:hypothetical protein